MEIDKTKIKVIAFDADDTLWVNETYFRDTEAKFASLLEGFETKNKIDHDLFKMVMKNLKSYGYGIKGFTLSMIETALEISNNTISNEALVAILNFGKSMIDHPVEILDGVVEVLEKLNGNYRLIVMTKGDLLDQERKVERSGLSKYFDQIEVLSNKKEENYIKSLENLNIKVEAFLMIGNSLKSDVLPVINIGAKAVHLPFHTTWQHEEVVVKEEEINYLEINKLTDILEYL